jgi:hypothetical protein
MGPASALYRSRRKATTAPRQRRKSGVNASASRRGSTGRPLRLMTARRVALQPDCERTEPHLAPCLPMSALPPKADMCSATRDVRFGPIADIDC